MWEGSGFFCEYMRNYVRTYLTGKQNKIKYD